MPAHMAPSPSAQPNSKRQRKVPSDGGSPMNRISPETIPDVVMNGPLSGGKPSQSSNFRNVSACNRCRLRKNRCDQKLPSCASCAKASVACVGYDPITKKEIPRSYVFYLETRVEQLEKLLSSNGIPYPPAENLELCSRPSADTAPRDSGSANGAASEQALNNARNQSLTAKKEGQSPAMMNLVGTSKPKSLASASGVSFARVVFAAVQYSVSFQHGPTERPAGGPATSMRDSFFGLHTRPTIQPAPFPNREVGMRLVTLYFEHANPQIPILHRGEFMHMFEQAYANSPESLASKELYMLNMVFAIGCGVIVGEPVKTEASGTVRIGTQQGKGQCEPEEYHASAIVHLESCLSFSGGGLEVLQAVLLLANFALLRPVPPGLWYITGVAVRLAVDLGLHYEEGGEAENSGPDDTGDKQDSSARDRGRRQYVRDMRRRLWWCTYSFDRLVSTCVGRPFGVSDQVITTELPSVLDDDCITPTGFVDPLVDDERPSYKHVAHHYFRLRMLQSEILQVLQYNQAQIARQGNQVPCYPEMRNHVPSPFLVKFDSFRSWRSNIDERLFHWKSSAPTRQETGVAFSTEFLELNYWQAIIMLYRQSLSVPAMFEGEYNTSHEVNSPTAFTAELREDEDRIYLKVAEAGQKILRIYRQLHLSGLVSYTYLSTHHLFMAGISYLYAIWHSPLVRSRLSMDEVDFTVLAAKSVFTDMIDKCPPAETCRDAFDRTAKATIKMASSNGGFGTANPRPRRQRRETTTWVTAPVPDVSAMKSNSRHLGQASDGQGYQFDLAMGENLSSPGLSAGGDTSAQNTPPLGTSKTLDSDAVMSEPRRHSGPSPADGSISQDGSSIDPLVHSPPLPRRMTTHGGTNAFMGQQFGMQGSMDYPDSQTMEFLQTLGATPNGDFSTVDQAQLDLGFGINWEGMHNDFSEGGHINPFDTFFFGGQPNSGNNNNSNNGNGSGGGMSM
ncbi:Positive regulator of purine utilization [Beauveria bassiana]|nr:Positive regulator of purine utilization [Beauveria bassiana]KAH8718353.1 Positive regulator of purine utilization [Beauveria bassiana]